MPALHLKRGERGSVPASRRAAGILFESCWSLLWTKLGVKKNALFGKSKG